MFPTLRPRVGTPPRPRSLLNHCTAAATLRGSESSQTRQGHSRRGQEQATAQCCSLTATCCRCATAASDVSLFHPPCRHPPSVLIMLLRSAVRAPAVPRAQRVALEPSPHAVWSAPVCSSAPVRAARHSALTAAHPSLLETTITSATSARSAAAPLVDTESPRMQQQPLPFRPLLPPLSRCSAVRQVASTS
jgi:hypothetical protein